MKQVIAFFVEYKLALTLNGATWKIIVNVALTSSFKPLLGATF